MGRYLPWGWLREPELVCSLILPGKKCVCSHACAHGLTHTGVTHKEISGVTFTKMLTSLPLTVRYRTSQGRTGYAALRSKPRHVTIPYREILFHIHVQAT